MQFTNDIQMMSVRCWNYSINCISCRVWGVWEDGILWDSIKSSGVSNTEAPWRNCQVLKQCHQLGRHCLDNPSFGCLHCRHLPRSLLDVPLCICHLYHGTHQSYYYLYLNLWRFDGKQCGDETGNGASNIGGFSPGP